MVEWGIGRDLEKSAPKGEFQRDGICGMNIWDLRNDI